MSRKPTESSAPPAAPLLRKFSLRSIYLAAMREVMADPLKAVAEHEPWLADLVPAPGADDPPVLSARGNRTACRTDSDSRGYGTP